MATTKKQVRAKIGTHSSTVVVLWKNEEPKEGDIITAMEFSIYNSLHHSYRRLKKCHYWKQYKVEDTTPLLFLTPWG